MADVITWNHGVHDVTRYLKKTRSFLFRVSQAGVSLCMIYWFVVYIILYNIYMVFVGKDKKGLSSSCRFQGIVLSAHVPLRYLRPSLTRQWPRMAPHALHATPSRQLPHLAPLSYSPCPMPPDHGSWWCFGETLETPCLIWMLYHIYIP